MPGKKPSRPSLSGKNTENSGRPPARPAKGVDPAGYYLAGPVQPARAGDSGGQIRTTLRSRKKAMAAMETAQEKAFFESILGEGGADALLKAVAKPTRRKVKTSDWPEAESPEEALAILRHWFTRQGWTPWPFQEEAWAAYLQGKSGLIHIPTGAGKTYGAYIAPLAELIAARPEADAGLQILFITPLRALTRDIELALKAPVEALELPVSVESRTGDTSSSARSRQRKTLPHVLITTPESLSLLLSDDNAREKFRSVKAVILDEWHEMLSSKRGIQVELALARLRHWNNQWREKQPGHPPLRAWALSATIANLHEAAESAAGVGAEPVIVSGQMERPLTIDTLLPENVDRFPWAGHLGARMLPQLVEALDITQSTLIFTNVRSHAERWFLDLLDARPEWAGQIALHHGSLDREEREFVERGLKEGFIKIVVCTSSLDLGVDFAPVERVFQIGSPKGVARLIQRAGRAAHRPGALCRITCVPTNALELVEIAAVRDAIARGEVEGREPLKKPYDVLAQHLVTCGLGGGFGADELYAEIRRSVAYRDLTREEFDWILDLVRGGGKTLKAYAEYHKLHYDNGRYEVKNNLVAQLHRFNIGTITSDSAIRVEFISSRKKLGTVEEHFISRLKKGDVFVFAGRTLEFVMLKDMVAYVRQAKTRNTNVPRWDGGKLPFSRSLGKAVRERLELSTREGKPDVPEIQAALPVLEAQGLISRIPTADSLLCEVFQSREGHHLFIFPFEGRYVHEGLAAVLALRLSRLHKTTFQVSVNDYGVEFVSQDPFPYEAVLTPALFSERDLVADILESMNISELARRQFREVARVAGLVYQNYPGTMKTARQLQASAGIIYDVFSRFDPENLFLQQSRREVLERQFEESRLAETLRRLQTVKLDIVHVSQPSPLAFPLMVERIGTHFRLSSESLAERVEKLKKQWMK